ncbi:MAG: aspartate aminotransferase family protein [Gemmatimonadota bacterium]|nr:aspartate aminotransferase family protein [Gemmatimonadota bacterium]
MSARLARVESRNVTYVGDGWPIFWQAAEGGNVRDVDDNVYIDLTSAFGVALLGHRSAPLVDALERRSDLVHGMGDVHPPAVKLQLLEQLASVGPWSETKTILATSGSEAVEAALKTAQLASGRPGILAFEGGYHGLTLGSLAATERTHFRAPFEARAYGGVAFAPYPGPIAGEGDSADACLDRVRTLLEAGAPNGDPIGTIIVEPVQARGGARVPPEGFMSALGELASRHEALVIADEIFTGLGRCGAMLASPLVGLEPDLVCIGKGLGGGLPISACLAPAEIMDAWPVSSGEAIHTSTFLGHPLACAVALGVLEALQDGDLLAGIRSRGRTMIEGLRIRLGGYRQVADVRGLGLLIGIDLVDADGITPWTGSGATVAKEALGEGLIVLPAAEAGNVVELAPPATLTPAQLEYAMDALSRVVGSLQ